MFSRSRVAGRGVLLLCFVALLRNRVQHKRMTTEFRSFFFNPRIAVVIPYISALSGRQGRPEFRVALFPLHRQRARRQKGTCAILLPVYVTFELYRIILLSGIIKVHLNARYRYIICISNFFRKVANYVN